MADDPNNPFARASAWPRMPSAPMRVGPLPKPDPRPEPVQTITPVFARSIAEPPPPRAEAQPPPPPPVVAEPESPMVVAPLAVAPKARRNWTPFALVAGIGSVVAVGSAFLMTREPAPPEPRLAAAVVEPATAVPAVAQAVAAKPNRAERPKRLAVASRPALADAPVATPEPPPEPAVEPNAPLEIPPVAQTAPPVQPPAQPQPVDPEAPVVTRSPY